MCGRYASSRQPEDLVEEFEIRGPELPHLEPDFNVAPTKEVYAVVERPPSGDRDAEPERQLRALTWGLVPFWAKDPKVGSRMINARMETVAEKPAYRRAFEKRRTILPADGYYEWYPTDQLTKAGKPRKQPYFIRPADGGLLAMAGLYEIWRDPEKADDDPTRFLWTCTVLTTTAEDSLGHIHDRMPLMLSPRPVRRLARPAPGRQGCAARPARAGRAREARGVPGLDVGLQREEQWSRAGGSSPAGGGGLMPQERMVETPKGPARLVVRRAKRPLAMLVLTHGAGGGIDAPDLLRLARTLPQHDISVALVEMPWRVAGKKLAPAPPVIDECFTAVLDTMRTRSPLILGGRSAGARSACRIARGVGARGVLALSFPLHPPGRPEKSRLDELQRARVTTLVVQGENDPFGRPEEFPDDTELVVVPAADHSLKVPKSGPLTQAEALAVVLEATLEWVVREVAGNRND